MKSNTDWLYQAKWGVFAHYLADTFGTGVEQTLTPDSWNRRIDAFDVEALASQLESVGAGYYCLSIGQNSGFYLSPNATYDRLTGITPSKLSHRDLVADLAAALIKRNIRLMVYFTTCAPAKDHDAIQRLRCTPPWDPKLIGLSPESYSREEGERTDERLSEFQRNWEAIIREWSLRWGKKVSGWWLDGAYCFDKMYKHADEPNYESFLAALKAGNPDSIISFNRGAGYLLHTHDYAGDDFTAGEVDFGLPAGGRDWRGNSLWNGRFFKGAQFHILSFLGDSWGSGAPRFPDDLVAAYTRYINTNGGVITWDVPPEMKGTIPAPFLDQLKALHCLM